MSVYAFIHNITCEQLTLTRIISTGCSDVTKLSIKLRQHVRQLRNEENVEM